MPSRSPRPVLTLNINGVLSATTNALSIRLPTGTTIYQNQTVTLSYDKTVAGTDALDDAAGNEVASFTDYPVTNDSTVISTHSTVATLSGLALKDASDDSAIDLNETFASGTKSYTADVATDVDEITVEPTSDHNATFAYLNASDTALTDADTLKTGFQAALAVGANTVKVKVTAEDGNANDTYIVVVTQAAAGNTLATGKPSITGAAQAGMTLTAGLGDIADADGRPASGYSYQWTRGGNDIVGATGSSFMLSSGNYGQKFRVRVSFTDDAGHSESRTSDETRPVAPAAAACPTDAETVWCARLTVGHQTEEEDGFIDVVEAGYDARSGHTAYGSVSGGATFEHLGVEYTVTSLHGGGTIDLYFATTPNLPSDGAGLTVHVQKYVGELDTPLAEGSFQSHDTLWFFQGALNTSASSGDTLSDAPLIHAPFGRDLVIPHPPDLGTKVMVRLSRVAPTGPATGKPKITGTAEVGQTLTAGTSGISDPDGNTKAENGDAGFAYTYQWYRVDTGTETQITGARGSTYTLDLTDEGKTFRVAVSFIDDAGNSEGPLKSNEYPAGAESGELRLVDDDGPTAAEGRLEVFHQGEWGTVCDDRLDNRGNIAPQKACQFMGYATGEWVPRGSIANMSVAPTTQPIWLDDVRCFAGSNHWKGAPPEALNHCYHAGWSNNNCTHVEDVHLSCSGTPMIQTEATALTATLEDFPTNHDGSGAFTFRIAFSADVTISPQDMKDHALTVAGGTVTNATRVDGRSDLWELTVEPAGAGAVSILVPQDRACTETGALCTADGQMLSPGLGHSVPGPVAQGQQGPAPLAAGFVSVPPEHDGQTEFWLELSFGAAVEQGSKRHIRALLGVTGGSVTRLRRKGGKGGRLDHWQIRIQPSSHEAVTVTLSPSPPCGATGAVCTEDGRTFTTALATQIQGPPGLTVADAEVQETANATLAFAVTLSRAPSGTVTVDYATSDGTATAGSDYTATSGTLAFAAGETEKTVSVPVLDDAHDEGSETLTLTLSNPSGAYLADGTATGTINNSDLMPQAWLARFGRTVADQVMEAVEGRVTATRTPGTALTVAGQAFGSDAAADPEEMREAEARLERLAAWFRGGDDEESAGLFETRAVTGREVLAGTSFALTEGTAESGLAGLWGRGAVTRFDGREGDLTLDGEVESVLLGADWARGRWAAGFALGHSQAEGGYRSPQGDGAVESTLTGVYPYGRYDVNDWLSLWGVVGYGTGSLTLTPAGKTPIETDMDLRLAALGGRSVLVEAPADGGLELAATSDAMVVQTTSDEVRGSVGRSLAASEAEVTRIRLGLEGAWRGIGSIVPSFEIGVRQDGGDAETGFGADIGAGLAWSDPAQGIEAEIRARGLLTHEDSSFRERGFAGSFAWDPDPASDLGPALTLRQTVGASATGGADALLAPESAQALITANDEEDDVRNRRLEATLGYGIPAFGGRYTTTPAIGFGLTEAEREYSHSWRLAEAKSAGLVFGLDVEAVRREHVTGDTGPEHRFVFGLGWQLEGARREGAAFGVRLEGSRSDTANDNARPETVIAIRVMTIW